MFTTDDRTEQFLKFNGIQFEYGDSLKYTELHPLWKANNIGRQKPIDQEAVFDYACRMEAGSPAPAVITIEQKEGHFPLDGVQRLMAGEENSRSTFASYMVSKRTSIAKQHMIRICANAAINGQHTPDKTFLLASAVRVLYFEDHLNAEEIARAIGRSLDDVKKEVRYQKTSQLMESVGYAGKLTDRKCKWFSSMLGQYAEETDWQASPGPIREMLKECERVAAKNGFLEPLVKDFFDIKRIATANRHEQFQRKLGEFLKAPEIAQHKNAGKGKHHIDQVLPAMHRLLNTLDRAFEADEIVHDGEFALKMADVLRRIFARCRELVPRDLQYQDGRRASIFDKG